jgi:hypothetical protein
MIRMRERGMRGIVEGITNEILFFEHNSRSYDASPRQRPAPEWKVWVAILPATRFVYFVIG